jgi:hypothetical protein
MLLAKGFQCLLPVCRYSSGSLIRVGDSPIDLPMGRSRDGGERLLCD